MYDFRFFRTRLGRATLASAFAVTIFAAMLSQVAITAPAPGLALQQTVQTA